MKSASFSMCTICIASLFFINEGNISSVVRLLKSILLTSGNVMAPISLSLTVKRLLLPDFGGLFHSDMDRPFTLMLAMLFLVLSNKMPV